MEAAFEGLTHASETGEPSALVPCFMNGEPAAVIAIVQPVGSKVHAEVSVEASSSYHYELESTSFIPKKITLQGYDVDIVQMASDKIVARVGVGIEGVASADFSFSVWDGIDKEYIGMGSGGASEFIETEAALLLTLVPDEDDENKSAVQIVDAEVIGLDVSVDFGDVGIDWGDPDDN